MSCYDFAAGIYSNHSSLLMCITQFRVPVMHLPTIPLYVNSRSKEYFNQVLTITAGACIKSDIPTNCCISTSKRCQMTLSIGHESTQFILHPKQLDSASSEKRRTNDSYSCILTQNLPSVSGISYISTESGMKVNIA
jgi:hypothetical protein